MKQTKKIFLDDWRRSPDDSWIPVESSLEFLETLNQILEEDEDWIDTVSFDYDLRETHWNGLSCFKILTKRCIKYGLPMPKIIIHSDYPGVDKYFRSVAESYERRTDQKVDFQYKPR